MPVDPATLALLFATGVVGGVVSVVVSLASLVTYPVLIALGVPPVAANVTNTVALTFNGLGAALGAGPELRGQRPLLLRLAAIAAAGGATGAAILLLLPGRTFELIAPLLIAGAAVAVLIQPRLVLHARFRPRGITPPTAAAYYATTTYSGYFGAGGGILAIVALSGIIERPLVEVNAAKSALAGVANGTAAIAFILWGPVRWLDAIPLAAGLFVGGLIGPAIVRTLPPGIFRRAVVVCGFGVAALLALRALG